jgi:hypothetical protein
VLQQAQAQSEGLLGQAQGQQEEAQPPSTVFFNLIPTREFGLKLLKFPGRVWLQVGRLMSGGTGAGAGCQHTWRAPEQQRAGSRHALCAAHAINRVAPQESSAAAPPLQAGKALLTGSDPRKPFVDAFADEQVLGFTRYYILILEHSKANLAQVRRCTGAGACCGLAWLAWLDGCAGLTGLAGLAGLALCSRRWCCVALGGTPAWWSPSFAAGAPGG